MPAGVAKASLPFLLVLLRRPIHDALLRVVVSKYAGVEAQQQHTHIHTHTHRRCFSHAEAAAPWPEYPGRTRLGNGPVALLWACWCCYGRARVRHCTLCCYCYCVVACYSSTTPIRLHSNTPHRLKHRLPGWERDPGALPAGPSSPRRVCRYIIVDDAGRLHNCNVLNALACSAVVSCSRLYRYYYYTTLHYTTLHHTHSISPPCPQTLSPALRNATRNTP